MTEIPDPPDKPACSACMNPLIWLWSPRRNTWVAFIPAPTGGTHAITPHTCRSSGDPPTWRDRHRADPPSPEYLAAKAALTHTEEPTRWTAAHPTRS